ncbi:probable E3 ubiquitin-protein ligase ZFP1 [Cucurbita maxima]|uniref:RING-type E3 ubiquitin transferase n=1 Tax=Cucurbita maxima TaxID=3661 RepID=A0A6J1IQT9_CUCMA|nr:probable E3 ubiquitin-protein ligase ZFP1 [Cucurbita maxima]XP_022980217.1 probable E3 ubiquitin-protein ligase ZFP1 [Cucurbita maxima]XP_022980227.1 probable E3 ubiquitin-protein ligase ZFP1 [Cucurbita maxima]XP_022980236.1 probable E3 ubiquitin-protein ligase ZFP1 [Cucurbita maxima]XP_022980245.1 probable E3 ubiquitin-protein ligase ZFP1 [Cucurbita maxima]XP_022980253.1 probable E3 ubiquitin-protein ligase ZFP1 [Cucurbita maxima]XP_022980261.1 probable E3 ubiquitin-protein ligase ZFP1 [C
MRQRLPRTSQMVDMEMDRQGQNYLHAEPSIILPGTSNFPQHSIPAMVTASGNAANPEAHYLPDPYEGPMLHGLNQYSGVQHHHSLGLSTAAPGNYYYSYVTPPSSNGLLPAPLNHNVTDQLPSASNYGVIQTSSDGYGRRAYFVDEVSDPHKRKITEGIPGNVQHLNGLASSSSSVHLSNSRHPEEVAMVEASSFPPPQSRWNGPRNSVRAGSSGTRRDSLLPLDHSHTTLGNNRGQHLQPANSTFWLDQHLQANCGNRNASSWNQASTAPFMQGTNTNGGLLETMNLGVYGYHETAGNRNSRNVQHPSLNHGQHIHNHPSTVVQRIRGQNFQYYPQVTAASYGFPLNSSYGTMNPHSLDIGRRRQGPVAPTSHGLHRLPRVNVAADTTNRHHNLPQLRFLQADEVALLEIPDLYEVGNSVDHHRDMRLDIEDMSYEELLALGERIGNVSTGLTEEIIKAQLKTRSFVSSVTVVNLEEEEEEEEEGSSSDQDADYCIICQDHYQNHEKIGTLDCGHEYHASCLKKWLTVKNVCPICKSEALVTVRKER